MKERGESFTEAHDVLVVLDRQHFAIAPKIRLPRPQTLFCQRRRCPLQIVTNQKRLSALRAKVVQPSCLMIKAARRAFEMSNVHCFLRWTFKNYWADHNSGSRPNPSGGARILRSGQNR